MNTKAIFHCGGGSNLILGIGIEKQIIFLQIPATVKFFHQIAILWCKKKSLPTQMYLYNTHVVPYTIPQGKFNFPKSTKKIQFFDEIFTSEKNYIGLMKELKYEHQSNFPLWGRVKLNFRDRYRKTNNFSTNSSHCQVFSPNCHPLV